NIATTCSMAWNHIRRSPAKSETLLPPVVNAPHVLVHSLQHPHASVDLLLLHNIISAIFQAVAQLCGHSAVHFQYFSHTLAGHVATGQECKAGRGDRLVDRFSMQEHRREKGAVPLRLSVPSWRAPNE